MTKDLSRAICEKCGMQLPGKLIFHKRNWDKKNWISAGCCYKKFDFESQPYVKVDILPDKDWNEKMGWQYPYKQIEEIKKLYDENGYDFVEFKTKSIDFGKSKNFVKLIELPIKNNIKVDTIVDYLCYICTRFWDRKSCLSEILYRIESDHIFGEKIKQAISEAKWDYD